MKITTLSTHSTKFWNGQIVEGRPDLAEKFMLTDVSETIGNLGEFKIIKFKKVLSEEQKKELNKLLDEYDFILAPAMFSSVDLTGVQKGKLFAFNATPETQRAKPSEKIASHRLSLIW